jgi:tetratricopeptide (TPR) repeat protein
MSSKPNHTPRGDRKAAERQFVGREEFVAPVQTALKEPPRTKPLVLVYHGGAGIGKSRLRRELTKQLAADPGVLTAALDFAIPVYRQPDAALFFLRNSISEAYKVRFLSFDIAYAFYWQKAHPDTPLASGDMTGIAAVPDRVPKEASGPLSFLSQLLDESGKLPLVGLIPKVSALVDSRQHVVDRVGPTSNLLPSTYYLEWWRKRGERELEDLPQMEPGAIVERLPLLWAADLKEFLVQRSSLITTRRAVLFIDSYERLWETADSRQDTVDRTQESGDGKQKTDDWVRELVKQLPEVLWIVCGRQKLRWEEVEKDWGNALLQHELGALPEQSARRFLESCDITSGQIQDGIIKGSQGVPHYLNLAVDTVQSERFKAQDSRFRGSNPDEVVREFTQHLEKPEVETLKVLSAARFWYYGLFEHLMTEYQTGYPLSGYGELSRFSFVKEGATPGTREMHELMREALRENQPPELRKRVHLFLHEYYARQLEGLDVKNITDRHRLALTEAFYHGRLAKSAEELWAWFAAAAEVFAHWDWPLIPLYRETIQSLETAPGSAPAPLASALSRLAHPLALQGELAEAVSLLRRALTTLEAEYGPEHTALLDVLGGLSWMLAEQARYDEAEAIARRVVGLLDKSGADATSRASALGQLAVVLGRQRKYPEAEELMRHELAVYEKAGQAPELALNRLGGLLNDQRRYAEAEPFYRRELTLHEAKLGANHPLVALALGNMALSLSGQCRYAEAEPLHRRALKLREEAYGPDHPSTAVTMNNLGMLLTYQGRYSEAEPLLRRALKLHEKKTGQDHLFTIRMARNLIRVLIMKGQYIEAEPAVMSAIATREQKLGPDHPETATVLHWAGVMRRSQGRYEEAEKYLRRALDARTRVLGPEHAETLDSLDELALLDGLRGRYAEAESLCREVLAKRERALGVEHPDAATTANRLANICCRDGRFAEAEPLYRRALAVREKAFGLDTAFVAEVLDGLAKVCEQTGRAAEAQELAERAKAIREKSAGVAQAQASSPS